MLEHGGCGIMHFDTSVLWPLPKWTKRGSWMSSPQWHFADFRLDPDNACLWRGMQPIALTPKAFDVLYYLVTHPDQTCAAMIQRRGAGHTFAGTRPNAPGDVARRG